MFGKTDHPVDIIFKKKITKNYIDLILALYLKKKCLGFIVYTVNMRFFNQVVYL